MKNSKCNDNENFVNALSYTKYIFSTLGVWSSLFDNSSYKNKIISLIILIFNFASIIFLVIVSIIFSINVSKDATTAILFLMTTSFKVLCLIKYTLILYHSDLIKSCIEYAKICWLIAETNEEKKLLIQSTNFGNKLIIISAIFLYSGGSFYLFFIPLSGVKKIDKFNNTMRNLPYPGYDRFLNNIYTSPNYEILYFWMTLSATINYTVVIGTNSLAAIFVTHVIGLIKIIMLRFKKLVDNNENNSQINFDKKFSNIIKFHVTAIKFAKNIEELLSEICLLEIIVSTTIICFLEYYIMLTWNRRDYLGCWTFVLIIISLSFNIFIFCYIGQYLQDTCQSLKDKAYIIDWYKVNEKKILALVLFIAMAETPQKLSAGGFMDMCLRSYGETIKSSFVYFNYLRRMT